MSKGKLRGLYAQNPRRAVFLLVALSILVAAGIYGLYVAGRWLEVSRYGEETRGDLSQRPLTGISIEYEGDTYAYRRNLLTILLLGIDRDQGAAPSAHRGGGQADFLQLIILDADNKTVRRLPINRDTMAEITTLGILGNVSGTRTAQIALSHGFGDGQDQSSQLTVEAVERLLGGIDIDFYMTVGLDAIPVLNDALGGVTVTIEDDFTALDPAMRMGETLRLTGPQAELFVRSRMSVGDGTNLSRMRRQNAYMSALAGILSERVRADANSVGTLYDDLSGFLLTDMNRGRMINEAYKASDYETAEPLAIPGESLTGPSGFAEFHPDERALLQLVLDTFFVKLDR